MKKLLTFVVLVGLLLSLQVAVASAQGDDPGGEGLNPVEEPADPPVVDPPEDPVGDPGGDQANDPNVDPGPVVEPDPEPEIVPDEEPAGAEQPVNQPVNREAPAEPVAEDTDVGAAGAEAGPWSSTIFASNPHASSAGVVIDFYDTGGNIDVCQ
jgi:hypothetical protein